MSYCSGKAVDLVTVRSIGANHWTLRMRSSFPAPGSWTSFHGDGSLVINRPFWEQLNRWALNFNHFTHYEVPSGKGPRDIDWFGHVGAMACHRPTAAHNRARGLDLCQVRFTDGGAIDMNRNHAKDLYSARLYLATVASLRRYFGTVLSAWYNSAHRDHLHIDDLTPVRPIRSDVRSDTTLIQASAVMLNGSRIAIDGNWGSQTERAYLDLVEAFNLSCAKPRSNTDDALDLLSRIMRAGLANTGASAKASGRCKPPKEPNLIEEVLDEVL